MNNFISFDKWQLPVFILRVNNDSNMMVFGDIGLKCSENQGIVPFRPYYFQLLSPTLRRHNNNLIMYYIKI